MKKIIIWELRHDQLLLLLVIRDGMEEVKILHVINPIPTAAPTQTQQENMSSNDIIANLQEMFIFHMSFYYGH